MFKSSKTNMVIRLPADLKENPPCGPKENDGAAVTALVLTGSTDHQKKALQLNTSDGLINFNALYKGEP